VSQFLHVKTSVIIIIIMVITRRRLGKTLSGFLRSVEDHDATGVVQSAWVTSSHRMALVQGLHGVRRRCSGHPVAEIIPWYPVIETGVQEPTEFDVRSRA
jgi:hypothetical protein